MQSLPRLFTDRGVLIADVDTSAMDGPTLARFNAIKIAYSANVAAQQALDAAFNEVTDSLDAVKAAESYSDARWPRTSFHDEWLNAFGSPEARAKRRARVE